MMMQQQMQMPPMPAGLSMVNFSRRMYAIRIERHYFGHCLSSTSYAWPSTIHGTAQWFSSDGIQWSTILIC
jgi:hypothetical protein